MNSVAVIGSGPSGWATAQRLVELGIQVDMYSTDLNSEQGESATGNSRRRKLNLKLLRGSDYPYRSFPAGPRINQSDTSVTTSFAESGLSLVWGATMLPYSKKEILDWPIPYDDLEKGYVWVTSKIPIAGRVDKLANDFIPFLSSPQLFSTSRIKRFLDKAEQVSVPEFVVGASRLAVYSSGKEMGCTYCKQCLTGCPTDLIWKSPRIKKTNFRYFGDSRVLKIDKVKGKFSLELMNKGGLKSQSGNYERVFIGAGPIESFRICASSGFVSSKAHLLDSQTFFLPILIDFDYEKVDPTAHTLAQAFCHLKLNGHTKSQLQIYDYSNDLVKRVNSQILVSRLFPRFVLEKLLQRLFIGIGYLDSSESLKILMEVDDKGSVNLITDPESASQVNNHLKSVLRLYKTNLSAFGLIPISPLVQVALPGQGVHYGGWLPAGKSSDLLGQPEGVTGIHVVDSSTFPSIPAGSITFTIMANAVRIVEGIFQ
jgi:hypothetical protein